MTRPVEPHGGPVGDDGADGPGGPDWESFDAWAGHPVGDRDHHGAEGDRTGLPSGSLDDDPRVRAGIEHVQRAAHEMIAASRALLDVAEELVDSPGGITKLFGVLGEVGDLAGRMARTAGTRPAAGDDDGPDQDPPVQRIPVS